MNTNTQEALAKVASLSEAIESFAKNIAKQKIHIFPIAMESDYDVIEDIDEDESHCKKHKDCLGCMDCLGLSWSDFL